jgi:hypothetical protein
MSCNGFEHERAFGRNNDDRAAGGARANVTVRVSTAVLLRVSVARISSVQHRWFVATVDIHRHCTVDRSETVVSSKPSILNSTRLTPDSSDTVTANDRRS